MKPQRLCHTCEFYSALKKECRKNPPTVFIVMTAKGAAPVAAFPTMLPEGWCGQYQPAIVIEGAN